MTIYLEGGGFLNYCLLRRIILANKNFGFFGYAKRCTKTQSSLSFGETNSDLTVSLIASRSIQIG